MLAYLQIKHMKMGKNSPMSILNFRIWTRGGHKIPTKKLCEGKETQESERMGDEFKSMN